MFYVNLNAAPFLAAFSNHYRAPRPSQPSRTSCSGRRATQSGCACSATDLNRGAKNKKAGADGRLYGGIEPAQVTAAKCLTFGQRRGKAAHRPANPGRIHPPSQETGEVRSPRDARHRRANLQVPTRAGAEDKNDSSSYRIFRPSFLRSLFFSRVRPRTILCHPDPCPRAEARDPSGKGL